LRKQIFLKCAAALLAVMLISCGWTGSVSADDAVIVTGYGIDRNTALSDAMRLAVEKKVGVLLDSQTIVSNARLLEDSIYTRAEGFIRDYEILSESAVGRTYSVKIRALVDSKLDTELMTKIQKIKIVETGLEDPRIGVMIKTNNYRADANITAENAVIKSLRENGFSRIIDLKQIDESKKSQIIYLSLQNRDQEAFALMSQFNVDYMVVGDITPTYPERVNFRGFNNFFSGRAVANLRIYNVNNAEIAFADTVTGTEINASSEIAQTLAVQNAAANIGAAAAKAMLEKSANPLQAIQVMVTSSRGIDAVKYFLSNIYGVQRVYLRDSRMGLLIFDLNFNGSVTSFVSYLEREGVTISEVSANLVKMNY
jgi:hypothetical protein